MKTEEQVQEARAKIVEIRKQPGLSTMQQAMLTGIQIAIVWVADGKHTSTMERLLAGEPVATGEEQALGQQMFERFQGHEFFVDNQ